MNPWERRPFPPLDLGAVDFDSIRWLVLDLFGPFLCSCACRFGEHWASSARLTVLVRAASQQQAEALVGSKSTGPGQKAAHGRTAAAARQGGDLVLGMAHGSREASTSRQVLVGVRLLGLP